MILEKIVRSEGSFEDLARQAGHMDRVLLHEGPFEDWLIDPIKYFFYHKNLGALYQNGRLLTENAIGDLRIYSGGVAIIEKDHVRDAVDATKILFQGEFDDIEEIDGRLVIRKGSDLLMNGVTRIYSNDVYSGYSFWAHPKGFVVMLGRDLFLNGSKLVFSFGKRIPDWDLNGEVVVTYRDKTFFLNDSFPVYTDWCDNWFAHKDGIVIQQGDKIYLVVLRHGWVQVS